MRLPELAGTESSVSMINTFLGLNKNKIIAESEFSDMKNMTTDYYPLLSPRDKHGIIKEIGSDFNGMANNFQTLVWAEGTDLYVNSSIACQVENSKKQFAMMGAYLVVFPDKIVYNMNDMTVESIEQSFTTGSNVTYTLCKADGTAYPAEYTYIGDDDPRKAPDPEPEPDPDEYEEYEEDPEPEPETEYLYWIDTKVPGGVVMKVWDNSSSSWSSVGTTYVKFSATNIGKNFKAGDGVRFSGISGIGYNNYDFNTTSVIQSRDTDWVVVIGLTASSGNLNSPITLRRECPDMDFICEHNNRLWGCSSAKHEIYGSKLGDPTNWYCYAGLSTDSYAATVGTEGNFTGAASYLGQVLFFKDRGIHRLQGSVPANFQLGYLACRGVQEGSEGSLMILNEYLYYKSRDGFVYFDGTFPREISQNLGTEPYYDAVSGAFRNKYYTCVRDHDYNWYQFVFDTEKGTWVQEGTERVQGYGYMNGAMYFVMSGKLMIVNVEKIFEVLFPNYPLQSLPGSPDVKGLWPAEGLLPSAPIRGEVEEENFDWYCVTGDIGMDNPYSKYIGKLTFRLTIDSGAKMNVDAMYDSSNVWEPLATYTSTKKRSFTIPVRVKRCDHLKLRISGSGDVKIFSIAKVTETGSETC